MDGARFDGITKRVVSDADSRRTLLMAVAAFLAGAAAAAAGSSAGAGGRCGPTRTRCGKRCCPRDAPICCGKKRCCQMHEFSGGKRCIRK